MVLLLRQPPEEWLRSFLRARRDEPFSYDEVGASSWEGVPEGYMVDHNQVKLGEGEEAFGRAVEALRTWKMFDLGWLGVFPLDAPIEAGVVVAVVARHYGFWSVNPCRILDIVEEDRRYGFAYGTLPGHAARGEERFTVEWRDDGSVHYDVRAISRPGPLMKLGYPLSRRLQRRFAGDSLRAMVES